MNNPNVPWWRVFAEAIEKLPPAKQAEGFAQLAIQLKARGEKGTAADFALRAWRLIPVHGDRTESRAVIRALREFTPKYHVQISTDPERVAAWKAALSDRLRPGMLALEIGAGSGILAMLAASAGADVVSCESDPLIAAIAEKTVRQNGLAGRIRIVAKPVQNLQMPFDLPRPADLLLLDLFGDTLFAFEPFEIVRAASRLLKSGAVVMPQQVSLIAALADFQQWPRYMPGRVAGFDLSPLRDIAALRTPVDPADPGLELRSDAETILCADPPDTMPAHAGTSERTLVSSGGPVNGVAVWLRLQLAPGHILEARPSKRPRGFYAKVNFFPLPEPLATQSGQQYRVGLTWTGKSVDVRLVDHVG